MPQHSLSGFYVEFDNKLGPKICAEYPEEEGWFTPRISPYLVVHGRISRVRGVCGSRVGLQNGNLFDSVSDYLIPKIDCCGKLVTVYLNLPISPCTSLYLPR